jgi:hypothetical protein
VDCTGTLRSTYNYDGYLTTGSRTSDFKFVSGYNDNTLSADQTLTLRKSSADFDEAFQNTDEISEVGQLFMIITFTIINNYVFFVELAFVAGVSRFMFWSKT